MTFHGNGADRVMKTDGARHELLSALAVLSFDVLPGDICH